jgi:7,8-dihydroneopterin aldolase/epimerase/oxygenase
MDKIIIKNAKYLCNVGITKEERKGKQEIIIDIELYFNIKDITDFIESTINYSEVNKKIKVVIGNKEYNLIETLANEIADSILKNFKVTKVNITVKKPKAIENADYTAIEITREK